jgi:hypothetical protein
VFGPVAPDRLWVQTGLKLAIGFGPACAQTELELAVNFWSEIASLKLRTAWCATCFWRRAGTRRGKEEGRKEGRKDGRTDGRAVTGPWHGYLESSSATWAKQSDAIIRLLIL